jgi:predicted metal-dependent peptidase
MVIAVDTSMSISDKDISAFLAEVGQVCDTVRPKEVHVLYWDSQVRGHEIYIGDAIAQLRHDTKPVGGGGTVVSCVNKYLLDHSLTPDAYVVLTDGYLGDNWGTWDAPVIWCIKNNRRAVPAVGVRVHID